MLEIVCINYVPVLYRLFNRTATSVDVRTCLGANVVLVCLAGALLHKPHNIVLTGALLLSCDRVNAACNRCCGTGRTRLMVKTIAFWWMSQMFFFYQGNSNSLASVDLNAGYVGVSSFNFTHVALFLTFNTYHALFVSLAVLLYYEFDPQRDRKVASR